MDDTLQTLDPMWVSSNLLANGGAVYMHANADLLDQAQTMTQ